MNAIAARPERKPLSSIRSLRIPLIIVAAVLAAALIVGGIFVLLKQHTLSQVNEALEELLARQGEYEEQSIVLYNTNTQEATDLAERIGAKLRTTENGKFATLTLPEGKTIVDIYSDDEFLSDISKMSADWHVSLSSLNDEEEVIASRERVPTAPIYTGHEGETYPTALNYMNTELTRRRRTRLRSNWIPPTADRTAKRLF